MTDNRDRVELTFSMRVQAREYEPIEVRASLASDVKEGEDSKAAFDRVWKEVVTQAVTRLRSALDITKQGQ